MEQDFGKYLATVAERDIDLLLMEEFHVSPVFAGWFADLAGVGAATFDGAWHSVADNDGETDLLLRVTSRGKRVGILIENKIAAVEQSRQADRYHIRGVRARDAGLFDDYVTCMCAPSAYLDGLAASSTYGRHVSYETIRDWFGQFDDARSVWRQRIMSEAIEQGRRGYVMIVDAEKTAFQRDYWNYLQTKHPLIHMREPKDKGPRSVWIVLKTQRMPSGVTLDHKNEQGFLDLTFLGKDLESLLSVKSDWPDGIVPRQKGKSAVLQKVVPKLDMSVGLDRQLDKMEAVMAAAYELSDYCEILQK